MKDTVQILFIQPDSNFSLLKNYLVLIDTSFLIDAYNFKQAFSTVLSGLKKSGCSLMAIDAVFYEFIQGRKSLVEYNRRLTFYDAAIEATLPIDAHIVESVIKLSKALLTRGSHISYTDCLQLATLIRFEDPHVVLLSKDRSDIPTTLFPIKMTINVDTGQNNCAFSVYGFDRRRYADRLQEVLQIK